MATLTIEGKRVKVDDAFLQMSPEEQQKTVTEIASQMGIDPAGEKKPEYTPSNLGGMDMSLLDRINTFGNGLVDQIPIVGPALSDFGAGVDAAWASMIEGRPVSKEERKGINKAQEEQYPLENIGGRVTGVVAPFVMAAPFAGASKVLGMSGSMGSRMGFGAASGAMISGADTAARGGDFGDVMKNGALGAATGAAFPVAEKGVKLAWDALRGSPMVSRPASKVADALFNRDKVDAATAAAKMNELGPSGVIADLGENVARQAGALATVPGNAQTTIANALKARQAGRNERITGDVDSLLGPAAVPSKVAQGLTDSQRALGPGYREAFADARAVDTTALAENLDAAVVNLRGDAQKAVKQVRQMLDIHGAAGNLDPNPATLFETRQAIDGMLATEANPKAIAALTEARQDIDAMLAEAVPGIKEVDAMYAELARQKEGLQLGSQVLDGGKTAIRPAEMADEIAAGVQPEGLLIGPSGKTFRVSQGARSEIDRIIGTTANNLNALKQALKGDGSWNRDKLAQLFGEEKADALVSILDREQTFQATYDAAFGNSKTAATLAAQKEFSPEVTGLPTSTSMTGLIAAALSKGAGAAAGAAKTAGNDKSAQILMSNGLSPELLTALDRAGRYARPSWIAPGAAALGVTTEKRKPIEIMVRGGNPALSGY